MPLSDMRRSATITNDSPLRLFLPWNTMAGRTGLEPAASGVTGRRYNQLNYRP